MTETIEHLPWDVQMRSAQCKVCKKRGLEWEMTPAGWRLFDGTQLHECFNAFDIAKKAEQEVHV